MKMRIVRGKSFRKLVEYVTDRNRPGAGAKHAEYICGTVLHDSVSVMVKDFMAPLHVRSVKRPVYHISLSMPAGEARRSREEWAVIAQAFMDGLGIPSDTPYAVYRHCDTDCDHVHIIACRVSLSGRVFLGQKDVEKGIRLTQELEERFGLTRTKGLGRELNGLDLNEMKMIERTQKLSRKQRIKVYVDASIAKASSLEDFVLILEGYGVDTAFNTASTGRVAGVTFILDGFAVKGSKLGSRYSYNALRKRLPLITRISALEKSERTPVRERTRTR